MAPAMASGGSDDRVEVSSEGQCSGTARWELKAKERDGGVEVEFEVDSNVVGQAWDYTLSGPSGVLAEGSKTTTAPSGSFSVEVKTSGSATDTYLGVATFDGQECNTSVNAGVGDDDSSDDGPGDDDHGTGHDDSADDVFEGTCSADSAITLKVKQKSKMRVAELELDSSRKGQKWRFTIERSGKTIKQGTARTKGRSGSFSVKAKTKSKGKLTASAERVSGGEDCSIDD